MYRRSGGTRGTEDDTTTSAILLPFAGYTSIPYEGFSSFYTPPFSVPTAPPGTIPSSTQTAFISTQTAFESSSPSPDMNEAPPPSTITTTMPTKAPTTTLTIPTNVASELIGGSHGTGWDSMGHGLKSGIIVSIVFGIAAVVIFSAWFCCGARAKRKKSPADGESGVLPLNAVPNQLNGEQMRAVRGDVPPPRYEEVVPAQHQRLAGGLSHVRDEEEGGIVADGKTPLSEIPFEDVVLDQTQSESSSSQSFSMRHHNGVGDTTGHTNS